MKPIIVFSLIVAAIFIAVVLFAGEPPRIVGTWEGTAYLDNGTLDGFTMFIIQEGGTFSGTCVDELGIAPEGTALEEIRLQEDALTFHLTTGGSDLVNISLKVDGDSMTGYWEDPVAGTNGNIELTRKK
jgi:hypothetical protein